MQKAKWGSRHGASKAGWLLLKVAGSTFVRPDPEVIWEAACAEVVHLRFPASARPDLPLGQISRPSVPTDSRLLRTSV